MLGLMGFIVLLIIVLTIYYLYRSFSKFSFINKIKNKLLKRIVPLIPLVLIFVLFNFVNSLVIILHLAFFTAITNLIIKLTKKEFKFYLGGILGIVLTTIYLLYGAYQIYHVYETKYIVETSKNVPNMRIVQIADSHVGTTFNGKELNKYVESINKTNPDIVVITGDLVDDDTSKKDMIDTCISLGNLKTKYGVFFAYGNHDKRYFSGDYTSDDLIENLKKNNVVILEDEIYELDNYYIVGRNDARYNRKTIDELTNDLDKSKYIIDLNHQPNDYEREKNKVDLVLSGHTHGGQMIPLMYFIKPLKIDDEYYGIHKRDNTTFIVTSGLSDWAVDFKTGTFSEYVVIDIVGNNE